MGWIQISILWPPKKENMFLLEYVSTNHTRQNVSVLRHIKSAMGFLGGAVYTPAVGTFAMIKGAVFEMDLKHW